MSDVEILDWLGMLHPKTSGQIALVNDLLHHAHEDGMTREDRAICMRALSLLGFERRGPGRPPKVKPEIEAEPEPIMDGDFEIVESKSRTKRIAAQTKPEPEIHPDFDPEAD